MSWLDKVSFSPGLYTAHIIWAWWNKKLTGCVGAWHFESGNSKLEALLKLQKTLRACPTCRKVLS